MRASLAASLPRPRGALPAGTLPAGIFLVLALLPIVALFTGGSYLVSLGSRVMIFAIAAVALDLLVGYGALISFGHAAFVGLGAYAVGILSAYGITDALVSLPVALAVSAAYAFLTGVVCLRTKGVYFIMITLAFGQMAFFTASSLAPFGGDDGLTIAARNTVAGFALLRNERAFYYVVLFCLLGTYMSWQRSGELIVMVLLGGLGSLDGAIIGAAAYLLTEEWLSGVTEHWKVIFGPVLVLIVLFARGGLLGLASALVRRLGRG
jgi:branched-chain amino acid transport system permease protein